MRFLVIGSGAREHVMIKSLEISGVDVYCWAQWDNFAIRELCVNMVVSTNYDEIDRFALENMITHCIVGTENALEAGVVDILTGCGIKCVGPTKELAKIETSKIYCRLLLPQVLSPRYKIFYSIEGVSKWILELGEEYVIKADGLMNGKGVWVSGEHILDINHALEICSKLGKFLIEEKLVGEEFSLMSFCSNGQFLHMPPIRDYKRLYHNGPNTGGMGCELIEIDTTYAKEINEQAIRLLEDDIGYKYCGVIYGSYMITDKGLRVIEFNARLGDPEGILVVEWLDDYFIRLIVGMCNGIIPKCELNIINRKCRYLVPNGYATEMVEYGHEFYIDGSWNNIYFGCVSGNTKYMYQGKSRNLALVGFDWSAIDMIMRKIHGKFYWRKDLIESNVDANEEVVRRLRKIIPDIGSYGAGNDNVIATVDGVGTKSILVVEYLGCIGYYSLGCDLVNHCINDLLVAGGKPDFFLDYFGSPSIKVEEVFQFVKGCKDALSLYGGKIVGGETAQMTDIFRTNDIVGFLVGPRTFSWSGIKPGDIIIGLPSSGVHTNGYTTIRKLNWWSHGNELCIPHKCYYHDVMRLMKRGNISGLCHITGGGLIENPPRVCSYKIEWENWEFPSIFKWIQNETGFNREQMLREFNCGIGMLVFIDPSLIQIGDWRVGQVSSHTLDQ